MFSRLLFTFNGKDRLYGRKQSIYIDGYNSEVKIASDIFSIDKDKEGNEYDNASVSKSVSSGSIKREMSSDQIASIIKKEIDIKKTTSKSTVVDQINLSQAYVTLNIAEYSWRPVASSMDGFYLFHSAEALFGGSFDIEISATSLPYPRKHLLISSVGAAVKSNPVQDSDFQRGCFNSHGRVFYYPTTSSQGIVDSGDWDTISLPSGWRRIYGQPESVNAENRYVRTTGWSVGVEGGGTGSSDPNATAKLTAGYSESDQVWQTINEFTAVNQSTAAVTDTRIQYTLFNNNEWGMFTSGGFMVKDKVVNLPTLAKSTLFAYNESVYEAPEDASGYQEFVFGIGHKVGMCWVEGTWFDGWTNYIGYNSINMSYLISLNLDLVEHPDD